MIWDRYKYLVFSTEKITPVWNRSSSSGLSTAWMKCPSRTSDLWVPWHCKDGMMDCTSNLCTRKGIVLMEKKTINWHSALYISLTCSFKYESLCRTSLFLKENSKLCIYISRLEDKTLDIGVLTKKMKFYFLRNQAFTAIFFHFPIGYLLASFISAVRLPSSGG